VHFRPDDYHVPYAGTAEDGRKFFLSEELFAGDSNFVGLFLWKADGTFDEVRVNVAPRPKGLPPGQTGPAGARALTDARLDKLGDYVLEPIEVEPFVTRSTAWPLEAHSVRGRPQHQHRARSVHQDVIRRVQPLAPSV
jgi:hypothetical protein